MTPDGFFINYLEKSETTVNFHTFY
jgi:hypothetical protein